MTNQSPKARGQALTKLEKLAFKASVSRQLEIQRMQQELNEDHGEILGEIEERLGCDLNGNPPTHFVDTQSWNVMEVPEAPKPELPPELPIEEPKEPVESSPTPKKTRKKVQS